MTSPTQFRTGCPFRHAQAQARAEGVFEALKSGVIKAATAVRDLVTGLFDAVKHMGHTYRPLTHDDPADSVLLEKIGIPLEFQRDIHGHILNFSFWNFDGAIAPRTVNGGFQGAGLPSNIFIALGTDGAFAAMGCSNVKDALNLFHDPSTEVYFQEDSADGRYKKGNVNLARFNELWDHYGRDAIMFEEDALKMVHDAIAEKKPAPKFLLDLVTPIMYKLESQPIQQEYTNLFKISKTPGQITREEHYQVLTSTHFFRDAHERVLASKAAQSSSSSTVEAVA